MPKFSFPNNSKRGAADITTTRRLSFTQEQHRFVSVGTQGASFSRECELKESPSTRICSSFSIILCKLKNQNSRDSNSTSLFSRGTQCSTRRDRLAACFLYTLLTVCRDEFQNGDRLLRGCEIRTDFSYVRLRLVNGILLKLINSESHSTRAVSDPVHIIRLR